MLIWPSMSEKEPAIYAISGLDKKIICGPRAQYAAFTAHLSPGTRLIVKHKEMGYNGRKAGGQIGVIDENGKEIILDLHDPATGIIRLALSSDARRGLEEKKRKLAKERRSVSDKVKTAAALAEKGS